MLPLPLRSPNILWLICNAWPAVSVLTTEQESTSYILIMRCHCVIRLASIWQEKGDNVCFYCGMTDQEQRGWLFDKLWYTVVPDDGARNFMLVEMKIGSESSELLWHASHDDVFTSNDELYVYNDLTSWDDETRVVVCLPLLNQGLDQAKERVSVSFYGWRNDDLALLWMTIWKASKYIYSPDGYLFARQSVWARKDGWRHVNSAPVLVRHERGHESSSWDWAHLNSERDKNEDTSAHLESIWLPLCLHQLTWVHQIATCKQWC